eukprot:408864-Pyramimonas_sp.AAC.1
MVLAWVGSTGPATSRGRAAMSCLDCSNSATSCLDPRHVVARVCSSIRRPDPRTVAARVRLSTPSKCLMPSWMVV